MIQRDDIGWEVGRGFRIGNSCTPVADSCRCVAKPIQYCKVKKKKKECRRYLWVSEYLWDRKSFMFRI